MFFRSNNDQQSNFILISKAKETLLNKVSRAAYDEELDEAERKGLADRQRSEQEKLLRQTLHQKMIYKVETEKPLGGDVFEYEENQVNATLHELQAFQKIISQQHHSNHEREPSYGDITQLIRRKESILHDFCYSMPS